MPKTKGTATAVGFYKEAVAGKAPLLPVYAVVGPEGYLRRQAVRAVHKLVEQLRGSTGRTRLLSEETDIPRFRRTCAMRLLGYTAHVVTLDLARGESWLKQEAKRDELSRYCGSPIPETALVIEAPKLAKNLKVAKAIAKAGLWIDCSPFKAHELRQWLIKQARRRKLEMSQDLANEMIGLVGADMNRLHSELIKLDTYMGDEARLSKRTLRDILCWTGDSGAFDLLDHLGRGDVEASLRTLQVMMRNGDHPFRILGLIQSRIRQHWKAAGHVADGASPHSAARAAGVPPFAVSKFLQAHKGLTLEKCRHLHDLLIEADRKASTMTPEARIRLFVMDGCRIFHSN